jgi:hypothetical protein
VQRIENIPRFFRIAKLASIPIAQCSRKAILQRDLDESEAGIFNNFINP